MALAVFALICQDCQGETAAGTVQARHADLLKTQERLVSAMEEAIARRDMIAHKVRKH